MSGKWVPHIKMASVKPKMQSSSHVQHYIRFVLSFDLCGTLYKSTIESVALCAAEIWGVENTEQLVSMQAGFWKRVLGVSQSEAQCGILKETASTDIRAEARTYAL